VESGFWLGNRSFDRFGQRCLDFSNGAVPYKVAKRRQNIAAGVSLQFEFKMNDLSREATAAALPSDLFDV